MGFIVAGETLVDYVAHTDASGSPVTGATFTVVSARKPDGSAFAPTITEIGNGVYRIQIATGRTESGEWYLLLEDGALSPARRYDSSWDVDPSWVDPTASGVTSASTRAQLRRQVGRLIGDLVVCTATETPVGNQASTFIDSLNLAVENNSLVGRRVWYAQAFHGANRGLSRRISENGKTTTSIRIAPDLPASTVAGDVIELWNERDLGPTPEDVNEAINAAIGSVTDLALMEAVSAEQAFDRTSPVLALPAAWSFFSGADWKDDAGIWHQVPPADLRIDVPSRTVELRNRSSRVATGRKVRFRGQASALPLTDDAQSTPVDAEWVTYQASSNLLIAMSHRAHDPASVERKSQYFQTLADARRPKTRARFAGRAVKLS